MYIVTINSRRSAPWLLLASLVLGSFPLRSQPAASAGAVDLNAPSLQIHAGLPQHNPPGQRLSDMLVEARTAAVSKGIPWRGIDRVATDSVNLAGYTPAALSAFYQRRTCESGAVLIGHAVNSAHHLSSSQTAVYSDYDFLVEQVVKDNPASSVSPGSHIVLTRLGGSLSLNEGAINYLPASYPAIRAGISYLVFLQYIPASKSYAIVEPLTTFLADSNKWSAVHPALSSIQMPLLQQGQFEGSIRSWAVACPKN